MVIKVARALANTNFAQRSLTEPRRSIVLRERAIYSGNDILHDMPMHVGEAVVAAVEAVGELLVIEAELVEDGRVQVVHVDLVLDGEVAPNIKETRCELCKKGTANSVLPNW